MLNLHPHYGLENVTRHHILREAERLGVAEASKRYAVHQSTIYKWRKVMEACPLPTLSKTTED